MRCWWLSPGEAASLPPPPTPECRSLRCLRDNEIYFDKKYFRNITKEQECDDGEGRDPAVWEDIGGGELLLGLGAHVGLYDVEADAQDGVGEAHPQHRSDQNQFTRESLKNK